MMSQEVDTIVIGAGIAGVSLAAPLASRGERVVVLEQEAQGGYHSTGRSAAVFSEVYGSSEIRELSRASRTFLYAPPDGFCDAPLVKHRGMLFVARQDQMKVLNDFLAKPDIAPSTKRLKQEDVLALCPLLRKSYVAAGAYTPNAADIDVHLLHTGYVKSTKRSGGRIVANTEVTSLEHRNDRWTVETPNGVFVAPTIVNAAGAWATAIARMARAAPIEIEPRRRTVLLVPGPNGVEFGDWPLVLDVEEQFYFKPDAGLLLVSPADETPMDPQDVQADELDIAIAVDRVESATHLEIQSVRHTWAGLRCFAKDRNPVVGFDPKVPGFFWLAGQGGYGIQTAHALGNLAANMVVGDTSAVRSIASGTLVERLSPDRFVPFTDQSALDGDVYGSPRKQAT